MKKQTSKCIVSLIACISLCSISIPIAQVKAADEVGALILIIKGAKLCRLGKFTEAIQYFDKAIACDPNCARAYEERARAEHLSPGGIHRSIEDCDRAIILNPKSVNAFDLRGKNYQIMRDYQKALFDFDAAIKLDPNNSSLYIARATVYEDLAQYDKALQDNNHALQLKPTNPDIVYSNRARVYNDLGLYEKAVEDTNKLIKSTSVASVSVLQGALDSVNLTNRGRAYLGLGQLEKAVADLTKAISLKPNMSRPGESFYFRAKAYQKQGKRALAAKDREMAVKLGYKPGGTSVAPLK